MGDQSPIDLACVYTCGKWLRKKFICKRNAFWEYIKLTVLVVKATHIAFQLCADNLSQLIVIYVGVHTMCMWGREWVARGHLNNPLNVYCTQWHEQVNNNDANYCHQKDQ